MRGVGEVDYVARRCRHSNPVSFKSWSSFMLITSRIRRVVLAAVVLTLVGASAAQHAAAQSVPATGATPATPSGPTLTEQLIGTAVSSPDSPQYKDVTEAITA